MSKYKTLLKNTGILAVGSFSSKILVFLLIPIYTAVLTESEYGSYDLILSTINLLIPILTLNITDAVLRFPMDKSADPASVARSGLFLIALSVIAVFLGSYLLEPMFFSLLPGASYVPYLYLAMALYQFLITLARGIERMKPIAIAGIMSAVLIFSLTVMLLLVARWGLDGYFVANIVGLSLPSLYLIFSLRSTLCFGRINPALMKRMVRYSLPLATTVIGWWLINSSGRYIVTAFCGLDSNGLLSIGYKIPAIFNTIVGVFLQSWQVSAVKEFDEHDADDFLSRTYHITEGLLAVTCACLIAISPILCRLLFADQFYEAWRLVPFLLIGALASSMSGMLGPFFTAQYATRPLVISTGISGIVCIVSCIILVQFLGVRGVAIGSMMACLANWVWRVRDASAYVRISFNLKRTVLVYLVMFLQSVFLVVAPTYLMMGISQAGCIALILVLNKQHLRRMLNDR